MINPVKSFLTHGPHVVPVQGRQRRTVIHSWMLLKGKTGTKQRIGNEFTDRVRVHFPVACFSNIRTQLFPCLLNSCRGC